MHSYHENYMCVRVLREYCTKTAIHSEILFKHCRHILLLAMIYIFACRIQTTTPVKGIAEPSTSLRTRVDCPLKEAGMNSIKQCAHLSRV